MVKILGVLGSVKNDYSFVKNADSKGYIQNIQSSYPRTRPLKQIFNLTNQSIIQVLEDLLAIDPSMRSSASDLLKNKIFDKIRDPVLEEKAPSKIYICENKTLKEIRAAILKNRLKK
jgi:serine/threonine protein kinase